MRIMTHITYRINSTKLDTINTGNNIETVNESNLKLHNTLSDSTSIHLAIFIVTGILLNPTSKKLI